jgi:hypothetical protein
MFGLTSERSNVGRIELSSSRFRRVSLNGIVLIALVAGIIGPIASVANATPIVAVDDAGADDEPGQKDLNALSVDYGLPGATAIDVKWNWDNTSTSGNNTRDGGALFDTDDDGFANYSLYVTVATDGTWVTRLFTCTADNRTDRCAGPTLAGTFASTVSVSIEGNSDPFGVPSSPDFDPNHVTGNTCATNPACYTDDTVADTNIVLADFVGTSTPTLLNVCSYPSGEPNSDPSDCVFEPNSGFLTIVKAANPSDGTEFTFNASEASTDGTTSWTIIGSSSAPFISYAPTTTLDLNEAVPAGWDLNSASCAIQTATPTPTGTGTATGVDNLEIRSGLETICTFTDTKQNPSMTVEKTSTTTSLSAPATVTYSYLVTNTGNVTLTGIALVDDNDNNDMSCPATTLAVGANMTCTATHTFTQAELDANGSPTAGSANLTNNVTASSNEAPDATDSLDIPINRPVTAQILPTATTCQNYLDGAQSLLFENYTVKSGLINSVAPGVFFYYNTITVNSLPYTFTLTQSNTSGALNWKPIPVVSVGQIVLYNANTCTKSRAQGTTTYDPNTGTVSMTVTATGTYVIGIKYDPTALKGTPVSGPPYPSVVYTFVDPPGSTGPSITVRPKP